MKSVIKNIRFILVMGVALLFNIRCRQPYVLPVSATNSHYLVVEGVIDNNPVIKLSRTVRLNDTVSTKTELNAIVSIEGQGPGGSSTFPLADQHNGSYSSPAFLALNASYTYRLKIITDDGKIYTSDYVPVKNSPPIDSINFEVKPDGLQVYSASHDPTNNTRYYRWDYNETWMIHSKYGSNFEVASSPGDTTIVPRPAEHQIFTCWSSDASTTIYLNSSAKLSHDVILHNPIGFVSSGSEKLGIEYSIQVNQYALTSDAFNYWQNLKKNTEQLGSIFDAQPSEIKGNIHALNNVSEPVIGYVSAGTVSQTRIFIGNSQVPYYWFQQIKLPYDNCEVDSVFYKDPRDNNLNTVKNLYQGRIIPINAVTDPKTGSTGFSESFSYCVDCRFRGTNVRPSFWVDKF